MAQRDSGKKKGRQLTEHLRYCSEKEWTFEQALADDELFNGETADPTRPISRWFAMRNLDRLQRTVAQSKKGFDVLAAVRVCANCDLVMPDWLVREFITRYISVLSCSVKSWDDAFGRPYPKGKHLAALRKALMNRSAVWVAVRKMHNCGRAINKKLFEEVGKPLGLGATLAEKLYYENKGLTLPVISTKIKTRKYRKFR